MESNRDNNEAARDRHVDWTRYGLGNQDNPRNTQRDDVSSYDGFGSDIYPSGANELYAQEYVS